MGFPYIKMANGVREIMAEISVCRDQSCLVFKKHRYYPTPYDAPFFYGRRPCMPVVPTRLISNKVMIIGQYPNCRFGYYATDNASPEKWLPVGDIKEPFEGGRYFDGYSVRDYPTQASLKMNYLDPLKLKLDEHIWLTNVVKCYLMKDSNIRDYGDVGWDSPPTDHTYNDFLKVATVCVARHLIREVEICQPQMIIGLGKRVYQMMHCDSNFQPASGTISFSEVVGAKMLAGQKNHPHDTRHNAFKNIHVIHLFHPSFLARTQSQEAKVAHENLHIPEALEILATVDLS